MSKLMRNEEGFTGLEAAIVLIAFVVVAAVFSYVMLGAGFFATGEAQRTVHTGVGQATSNLEVSGPVVVQAETSGTDAVVGTVYFYLQLAAGGNPVDMSKVTYTVTTKEEQKTFVDPKAVGAATEKMISRDEVGKTDTDNMLESLEMMEIGVPVDDMGIGVNDEFMVEIKPDVGAALPITKHAPPSMEGGKFYTVN